MGIGKPNKLMGSPKLDSILFLYLKVSPLPLRSIDRKLNGSVACLKKCCSGVTDIGVREAVVDEDYYDYCTRENQSFSSCFVPDCCAMSTRC